MRTTLALVLVACGGRADPRATTSPASTPEPLAAPSTSACAGELAAIQRLYLTVADEQTASPAIREPLDFKLPVVRGRPSDASKWSIVVIHANSITFGFESADPGLLSLGDLVRTPRVALAIAPDATWKEIDTALDQLKHRDDLELATLYRVNGTLDLQPPPEVDGLGTGAVDVMKVARDLDQDVHAHCPAFAAETKKLSTGEADMTDPNFLRSLAATIPTCTCEVDRPHLAALPYLIGHPLVTLVPFATRGAPLPKHAPTDLWSQTMAAAGGDPITLALPDFPPRVPPPPMKQRR